MMKFSILLVLLSVSYSFSCSEAVADLSTTDRTRQPSALGPPFRKCIRKCTETLSFLREVPGDLHPADRAMDVSAEHTSEKESGEERSFKSDESICVNICFAVVPSPNRGQKPKPNDGDRKRLLDVCHCAGTSTCFPSIPWCYCTVFKCGPE